MKTKALAKVEAAERRIRLNDWVRVVIPKIVVRVGYPKTVDDYMDTARDKYASKLKEDIHDRHLLDRALRSIAHGIARANGFGGTERSLHFLDVPDLLDKSFRVSGIRSVRTGTYYPPSYSSSGSCWGGYEEDWEPGGLRDMKVHRLVTGLGHHSSGRLIEIPVAHCIIGDKVK